MNLLIFLKESFLFAYNALKVNRLRTVLTLLGITIGIFAIISVLTVFKSLELQVRESLSVLGDNVVYVQQFPWVPEDGQEYKWWDYLNRPTPSYEEYELIEKLSDQTAHAAFSVSGMRDIKFENRTLEDILLWANSHDFDKVRSFDLEDGRYFTKFESNSGTNVAIIGHTVAEQLFPYRYPIGKEIKISGFKATIIGVAVKEGQNQVVGGGSLDEAVLIPVKFAAKIIDINSRRAGPMIIVKGKEGVPVQFLVDDLRGVLRAARSLRPREKDSFALNQSSMLSAGIGQIFAVINLVGWIIGGFSIIVGGFGIANIMFVSVKERTKLIGIQKALGAKKRFILLQFLFESTLLSIIGGSIGLIIIFIGSLIANSRMEFDIILTPGNIMLGLIISAIIGLVSGYAPAQSAAKMNPVDAINTAF